MLGLGGVPRREISADNNRRVGLEDRRESGEQLARRWIEGEEFIHIVTSFVGAGTGVRPQRSFDKVPPRELFAPHLYELVCG